MATYAELTTEQKSILDAFVGMVRSWSGEQARTNNHGEAINDDYNAQVSAIITTLDAGALVPNESGLSGAASLTKEDIISIVSHIQGVQTSYNTSGHRQLWTKASGAANLIG